MILIFNSPEQIPFCKRSYVAARTTDNRDGRISVVLHLFQGLAQCVILIDISHLTLGSKEK